MIKVQNESHWIDADYATDFKICDVCWYNISGWLMFYDYSVDHKYHLCNLRTWFSYVPSNTVTKKISRIMRKICEKPNVCEGLLQCCPMSSGWHNIIHALSHPGPLFTKKTPSYGYRDPHDKPKTVWRPSQVYNGNPYTDKTASS